MPGWQDGAVVGGQTWQSGAPVDAPTASRDKPGFLENLVAPAKNAFEALKTDVGRFPAAVQASGGKASSLIPGVSHADRVLGSILGDAGALVTSPISGVMNAAAVEPGADLLDHLPAPLDPKTGKPMTPEQQHAKNAEIISTALMAVGPKGLKGGRLSEFANGKYAAKVAKVVTEVPPEVALDEKGALTEEGQHYAAQHGIHPEDLQTAYKAVKEAPAEPPGGSQLPPESSEPPPGSSEPPPPPQDNAQPVQAAEMPQPTGALETPPADVPAAPPEAAPAEPPIEQTAADRVAQAASEGVDLSKGQATQDFGAQSAEEQLKGTQGPEGTAARQFFAKQQAQIGAAVDRFKAAFGDPDATAETRGALVKGALTELRDQGKAGVSALYEQARKLAEAAGGENPNLIHLDTAPILKRMREIFIDEGVDAGVRQALKQQAAKYGLIGEAPKTVEGETSVTLRDSEGQPADKIRFTGPPQRLTLVNSEDLRQFVNSQYPKDTTAALQSLKPLIDDAVQGAVQRIAREGEGNVGHAYRAAAGAHIEQLRTFKAGDVVQKLVAWKKGTQTPAVLPENAIKSIFAGGKEAVTELKKVKAVLLSKPTPNSKAAWQAIQAHAVADIFEKAMVLNARMEGGELTTISGAKLNTAITKFGVDKLKILLPEAEFNQLMKLRRIVGDATIPIDRVANHSGSGWAVIRFLAGQGVHLAATAASFIPGVREVGHMASGLSRIGREAAAAKATLKGIEGFDEAAAAKADAPPPEPADYARKFVKVAGSDETLATLLASAANEQRR